MRNKVDAGFTMLEILIAIAVVGVLAVVAIPQYQDYVIRSKVSECLNFAGPAKNAIAEAQASQRSILFDFTPTTFCANVQLAPDGTIVLTTQATGAKEAPVLQMTPWGAGGGQLRWDCQFVAGAARHVPASCRTPGIAVPADKLVDSSGSGGTGGSSPAGGGPAGGAGSDAAGADSADGGSSSGAGGAAGDSAAGAADSGGGTGEGSTSGASDDGAAPPAVAASATPPAGSGAGVVDSADGGSAAGGGGEADPGPSAGGAESGGGGAGAVDAGGGGGGVVGVIPPVEEPNKDHPKEAEKPLEECPHKLPSGAPHPGRCKDWGK